MSKEKLFYRVAGAMSEKDGLQKSLTWLQGTALTVGGVIGSGILVLPSIAAVIAGPASLISWALMGLLSLPMVLAVGEMSSAYPNSGGIAAYAEQAFSPRVSQLITLLILTAMPIGMPFTALVGANYLADMLGLGSVGTHVAAGMLLIIAAALNYRGIELSGNTQIFVVGTIIFILLFVVLSAAPQVKASEFTPFFSKGALSVAQTLPLLFFAFLGWEMVGHVSEEFKNPEKDIQKSLNISFVVVNSVYILTAIVIIGSGVYKVGNPNVSMVTLVTERWGSLAAAFVSVLGFVACYCPIHTYTAGFSRLIYSQSRGGSLPAFLGKIHPRYKTPHIALIAYTPVFIVILSASCIFSWDLRPLISFPSASFLMVYTIGMFSVGKVLTSKRGKLSGYLSAIMTFFVLLCSGLYALLPISITIAFLIKYRKETLQIKQ